MPATVAGAARVGAGRSIRKEAPDQRADRGLILLAGHLDHHRIAVRGAGQGKGPFVEARADLPAVACAALLEAVAIEVARPNDETIGRVLDHREVGEAVDEGRKQRPPASLACCSWYCLMARSIAPGGPKYALSIWVAVHPASTTTIRANAMGQSLGKTVLHMSAANRD
jgi:hypothetical protein